MAAVFSIWVPITTIFLFLTFDLVIIRTHLLNKLELYLHFGVCVLYAVSFAMVLRFDVRGMGCWMQLGVSVVIFCLDSAPPTLTRVLRKPLMLISTLAYLAYMWVVRGSFQGGIPLTYPDTDYFVSFGDLGGLARSEIIFSASQVAGETGFALALLSFKDLMGVMLNRNELTHIALHIHRPVRIFDEEDKILHQSNLPYDEDQIRYWHRSQVLWYKCFPTSIDKIVMKVGKLIRQWSMVLLILFGISTPGFLPAFENAEYLMVCSFWVPIVICTWLALLDFDLVKEIAFRIDFWISISLAVAYSVCLSAYVGYDFRLVGIWFTFPAPILLNLFDASPPSLARIRFPLTFIAFLGYAIYALIIRLGYVTPHSGIVNNGWDLDNLGGLANKKIIISDQQMASDIAFTNLVFSFRDLLHVYRFRNDKDYRSMHLHAKVKIIDGEGNLEQEQIVAAANAVVDSSA
jgi:hypothetical protein